MDSSAKPTRLHLWRTVLSETAAKWWNRDAMTQSGALAFFALFSLTPVLIFVVAIAGVVFGEVAVRGQIVHQFESLMGREEAQAVDHILKTVVFQRDRPVAGMIGFFVFAFGATAVFVQLQTSLNLMWDVAPRPGPLVRTLLKKRLVSFALVIAIGFLLVISLALSAAIAAMQEYVSGRFPIPARALDAANALLSFLIFTVLFAMMFRILPDAEIPWRDVWFGALVTSALLSAGKWAIGLYLGRTALASSFGAAASVIVILFWVYYASLLVLLGAVFTRVYSEHFYHSRHIASPGATGMRVEHRKLPKA